MSCFDDNDYYYEMNLREEEERRRREEEYRDTCYADTVTWRATHPYGYNPHTGGYSSEDDASW